MSEVQLWRGLAAAEHSSDAATLRPGLSSLTRSLMTVKAGLRCWIRPDGIPSSLRVANCHDFLDIDPNSAGSNPDWHQLFSPRLVQHLLAVHAQGVGAADISA